MTEADIKYLSELRADFESGKLERVFFKDVEILIGALSVAEARAAELEARLALAENVVEAARLFLPIHQEHQWSCGESEDALCGALAAYNAHTKGGGA